MDADKGNIECPVTAGVRAHEPREPLVCLSMQGMRDSIVSAGDAVAVGYHPGGLDAGEDEMSDCTGVAFVLSPPPFGERADVLVLKALWCWTESDVKSFLCKNPSYKLHVKGTTPDHPFASPDRLSHLGSSDLILEALFSPPQGSQNAQVVMIGGPNQVTSLPATSIQSVLPSSRRSLMPLHYPGQPPSILTTIVYSHAICFDKRSKTVCAQAIAS